MYDDDYEDDDDDYEDDENDDDEDGDDEEDGYGDDNEDPFGEDEEPEDDEKLNDDDGDEKGNAKKSKNKGDESENSIKGEGAVKGKLDTVAMNKLAQELKCPGVRTHYKCPFCKQESIYMEPIVTSLIRKTLWYISYMGDREQRYVCLNKKCKAYYQSGGPSARFVVGATGTLKTTHGLSTPQNPFSMRPQK